MGGRGERRVMQGHEGDGVRRGRRARGRDGNGLRVHGGTGARGHWRKGARAQGRKGARAQGRKVKKEGRDTCLIRSPFFSCLAMWREKLVIMWREHSSKKQISARVKI
jgi:hypothetical protein